MYQNLGSPNPMQPLSIGNVVTAGVRLYRSNLKTYLKLAASAYLWVLVPIYGWAKYAAISGLISRLAFGELVNQPESVSTAHSKIMPRLWSFFRIAFQVGISLFLVYIGLTTVALVLAGIVGGIVGTVLGGSSSLTTIIVITTILASAIILLGLLWFYSRWIIAEVPLAVEENINGGESVARSWDLTKSFMWRIQGIVLVTFVVSLPIVILFSYLPQLLLLPLERGSSAYIIVYLITFIISLVGGVLVMPFWQAIKAVIYYDLRTRREGLGLKLRDRNI